MKRTEGLDFWSFALGVALLNLAAAYDLDTYLLGIVVFIIILELCVSTYLFLRSRQ